MPNFSIISFINNFDLGLNEFYQIFTTGGTQSGQFIGLTEGSSVGFFNSINLYITYDPVSSGGVEGIALYTVPEPSAAFLVLLAGGAWALRRKLQAAQRG